MATFATRIEDLVGVVAQSYGGSSDTDFINDAMREAIYEIIQTAPEHVIHNFTQTSAEITSNGSANPNMKILAVQRESGVDGDFIEFGTAHGFMMTCILENIKALRETVNLSNHSLKLYSISLYINDREYNGERFSSTVSEKISFQEILQNRKVDVYYTAEGLSLED